MDKRGDERETRGLGLPLTTQVEAVGQYMTEGWTTWMLEILTKGTTKNYVTEDATKLQAMNSCTA